MIPSGCRVHLPVTSPTSSAFPKSSLWVGFPNRPAKRLRAAGVSRPSPFLTFRPPGLLATQVSPTAAPKRPQGSRDFSTRANHASLPMHASGMLAVRIRQLTAVGLSPPKTCSLVGRYPGFEPATLRLTAKCRCLGSRVLRAGSSDENLLLPGVWQRIVQRLCRPSRASRCLVEF